VEDRDISGADTMRYRDAPARRLAALEIVRQQGFSRVSDLSDQLGVSRITVRRDIARLEEDQLVRGAHGGVVAMGPFSLGTHFETRSGSNVGAKRAIARKAIEHVMRRPLGPLGIDAGTTGFEVARLLTPESPLIVVTHSLPVMLELAERPHVEVVGAGGVLHPETQAFAGPSTVAAYSRMRLDTVLLTASAVRSNIMFCGNAFDAETKRQMMTVADEVVLLVDASKFEGSAPFQVAELARVDVVVVDHVAPEALLDSLASQGLQVLIADPDVGLPGEVRAHVMEGGFGGVR
jgi:DeoR/GlpR family transcriptional regulator of sugar metabolism